MPALCLLAACTILALAGVDGFADGGLPFAGGGDAMSRNPREMPTQGGPGGVTGARVSLGVLVRDVEVADLPRIGIREPRGALVERLQPGGAAAQAGLAEGDIVLTVGRQSVMRAADLGRIVASHAPGDQIDLTVFRRGQVATVHVRFPGSGQGSSAAAPAGGPSGGPTPYTVPRAGGAAPTAGTGSSFYRMRMVHIMDQYGFGQPVETAHLLIPADWHFESDVRWGPATGCTANLVRIRARATSPDGTAGIEFFTPDTWQWHDDPMNRQAVQQSMAALQPALRPCEMRPPARAVDFIRNAIVARVRLGARVVGAEPMPEVARAQQALVQQQYAEWFQRGLVRSFRVDAGKVRLAYEVGGRPVEEWITGMVMVAATPAYSASAAMQGGLAQVNAYNITATNLVAVRAPAGELERHGKLYATIIGSIQANPRWAAAVQQVTMNINSAAIRGAAERSAIWTRASHEIDDLITSRYQQQQAVQDQLAAQYSESVRGIETFVDPATHERVQLTAGYRQAWSNQRGEYILSDDPNFNPAVALREQWVELQRPR